MNAAILDLLHRELPSGYTPGELPNGIIRIATPFRFRDGDQMDVFVEREQEWFNVTDFGETLCQLRPCMDRQYRHYYTHPSIAAICEHRRVERYSGEFRISCNESELAKSIAQLSAALSCIVQEIYKGENRETLPG